MLDYLTFIISRKCSRNIFFYTFVIIAMFCFTDSAWATEPGGLMDNVQQKFESQINNWKTTFVNASLSLLFYLTVINLFWRSASLMFRGNNVADIFFELIRTTIIYGFFYYLLTHLSQWSFQIIVSFMQLGSEATGEAGMTPSGMIDEGVKAAGKMFDHMSYNPLNPVNLFILFCAIVCILVFTFVAVNLIIALIVFNFTVYVGALLLGFAGTEWTRNSALQYLNACLASGLRYLATLLVAHMSAGVFDSCLEQYTQTDWKSAWVPLTSILVAALLTYILIHKLPDMVANLISPAGSGMGITSSGFAHATGIAQVGRAAQSMAMSAAKIAAVATGAGAVTMAAAGIKAVTGGVPGAIKAAAQGGSAKAGFMAGYDGGGAIGMAKSAMGAIGKTLNHIPPFRAASSAVKQMLEKGGSQKAMASNMAADLRKDGMGAAEAKTKGQQMASQAQGYMRQGMGREAAKDMAYNDVMRRGGGDASRVTNAVGGGANESEGGSPKADPRTASANMQGADSGENGYTNVYDKATADRATLDPATNTNQGRENDYSRKYS